MCCLWHNKDNNNILIILTSKSIYNFFIKLHMYLLYLAVFRVVEITYIQTTAMIPKVPFNKRDRSLISSKSWNERCLCRMPKKLK